MPNQLAKSLVKQFNYSFTFPSILTRYEEFMDSDNATIDDFAQLIMTDPIIAASVLKLANSAMYNFPKQISELSEAISIIGLKGITQMIYLSTALRISKDTPLPPKKILSFWKKCLMTALLSKSIGKIKKCQEIEVLFVSGLLSTIGSLPIILFSPKSHYENNLSASIKPWDSIKSKVGFTQNELSSSLLESWSVPPKITIPIKHAHIAQDIDVNLPAVILNAASLLTLPFCHEDIYCLDDILEEQVLRKLGVCELEVRKVYAECIILTEKMLPNFI
jgi:HD-like signal output (HDOD) protein